jgi:hypothetical protein
MERGNQLYKGKPTYYNRLHYLNMKWPLNAQQKLIQSIKFSFVKNTSNIGLKVCIYPIDLLKLFLKTSNSMVHSDIKYASNSLSILTKYTWISIYSDIRSQTMRMKYELTETFKLNSPSIQSCNLQGFCRNHHILFKFHTQCRMNEMFSIEFIFGMPFAVTASHLQYFPHE